MTDAGSRMLFSLEDFMFQTKAAEFLQELEMRERETRAGFALIRRLWQLEGIMVDAYLACDQWQRCVTSMDDLVDDYSGDDAHSGSHSREEYKRILQREEQRILALSRRCWIDQGRLSKEIGDTVVKTLPNNSDIVATLQEYCYCTGCANVYRRKDAFIFGTIIKDKGGGGGSSQSHSPQRTADMKTVSDFVISMLEDLGSFYCVCCARRHRCRADGNGLAMSLHKVVASVESPAVADALRMVGFKIASIKTGTEKGVQKVAAKHGSPEAAQSLRAAAILISLDPSGNIGNATNNTNNINTTNLKSNTGTKKRKKKRKKKLPRASRSADSSLETDGNNATSSSASPTNGKETSNHERPPALAPTTASATITNPVASPTVVTTQFLNDIEKTDDSEIAVPGVNDDPNELLVEFLWKTGSVIALNQYMDEMEETFGEDNYCA
jgi:hypothetical protein